MLATLRWAGTRRPICTLPTAAVDLTCGQLTVIGKGGRQRVVPLPGPLLPVLTGNLADVRPQLPAGPALFPGRTRDICLSARTLQRLCTRHGPAAAVNGPHHPMRWPRTYATSLIDRGVPLPVVQALRGHSQAASALRYVHVTAGHLRTAVRRVYPK